MSDPSMQIDVLASEALNLFIGAVEQVPAAAWDQPSVLDGWSIRDLVGHVTGSAAKVVALLQDREIWGRSEPADWICPDPAARLRELAADLREALPGAALDAPRPSPQGELPLRRALAFPVADLAMHSWDLHRSQDRLVDLPEDLLAFCRGLVDSAPPDLLRSSGAFGPPRPAPPGASPTTQLMAFLGRPA